MPRSKKRNSRSWRYCWPLKTMIRVSNANQAPWRAQFVVRMHSEAVPNSWLLKNPWSCEPWVHRTPTMSSSMLLKRIQTTMQKCTNFNIWSHQSSLVMNSRSYNLPYFWLIIEMFLAVKFTRRQRVLSISSLRRQSGAESIRLSTFTIATIRSRSRIISILHEIRFNIKMSSSTSPKAEIILKRTVMWRKLTKKVENRRSDHQTKGSWVLW